MKIQRFMRFLGIIAGGAIAFAQAAPAAASNAHFVANDGVDTNSCGASDHPCRSISQAIENASNGDTVWVRAGMYGDLNNDSRFDAPGEEHPSNGPINCMICIFKNGVQVLSVYGPAVTIINGGDTALAGASVAVALEADGAVLGTVDNGFTIKGGGFVGVEVRHGAYSKVIGNIVENGIAGSTCVGPVYITDNIVSHSAGIGYQVIGEDNCPNAGPIYLTNNVASDVNGPGFTLASIDIVRFVGNVSRRNVVGANIITVAPIGGVTGVISNSAFIANRGAGIQFSEGGATVTGNTILGNQGPGISVSVTNPRSITLHNNNIYGNDISQAPANCGVLNNSAVVIDAKKNFWGSATGPGSDPADNAGPGSGCDLGHSSTVVTPFATTHFPVSP